MELSIFYVNSPLYLILGSFLIIGILIYLIGLSWIIYLIITGKDNKGGVYSNDSVYPNF
jgi:hypothetical protein